MDEEKKQRMIDKAIDKLGISEDLIDECYYPVSRMDYGNEYKCEFKEQGVCLILKQPPGFFTMSLPLTLLVFGLEDSDV